jgi:hypothetical protein
MEWLGTGKTRAHPIARATIYISTHLYINRHAMWQGTIPHPSGIRTEKKQAAELQRSRRRLVRTSASYSVSADSSVAAFSTVAWAA